MKKRTIYLFIAAMLACLAILSACQGKATDDGGANDGANDNVKDVVTMSVTSEGIVNGQIEAKYGKYGDQFNENGMPTYSLPFSIENAPENTVSYAIVLEDKDAYSFSGGFSWIHWTAANITRSEIKENESQTASDFVQGANSWMSMQGGGQSRELSSFYGGMAPPDAPHLYELHVFALDTELELENGFYMNELYKKMDGHILDQYTLKGSYNN